MIKRKVSFGLILTLVVAGLILAMLPAAAVAAPGIVELNWSEAAFEGNDVFYGGVAVVAYKAGSTAKMEFRVRNDSAADLNIIGAQATFDWGTCSPTVPATFPFVLKAGDYAIFGGIPGDISATRFDWNQPYLDKWIEAMTMGHETEAAATEVWIGASADADTPSVFYSNAGAEADACLMDEADGEHHFPIYTPRGKSLSYRLLTFARGFRVRIRSLILSVRSPAVDEVEA